MTNKNEKKNRPLGRAAIVIGLAIVLLGLIYIGWQVSIFGLFVIAIGFAIGGRVQT